ncbi:hypothetical protein [Hanstruepera marina]|uniref:hypothetical protein n=1 Tax=Hanstruepera marina TaxID=2873265 RepID=UPI001CA6D215|nr:hypothetical protein [Hanstruepera marina]
MRISLVLLLIVFMSCSSEKIIELPEIKQAKITEINDVSPAYLFYDEMQPDSVELNRKNLISTTNWLVNVDKRLTLGQAIPRIQFLQQKKNNSSHKNEAAKNYYTCHDLSENNLGFIEFTGINYHLLETESASKTLEVIVETLDNISIKKSAAAIISFETNLENLISDLKNISTETPQKVSLRLKASLTFQDYISLKEKLTTINFEDITIDNNEFIY